MTVWYNENNAKKAAWLRELIRQNVIAPGVVDERSILDVRPEELREFRQCHFFAGIGIWSYALRLAGWPDSQPVWTGSCPCQPFSTAGKGDGFDDERHLWPAWHHLIAHGKRRDIPIYFEQVASNDGLAWLDLVQSDMENENHTCRAIDWCAAGIGSPNIRQRLYGVVNADEYGNRGEIGRGNGIAAPETFGDWAHLLIAGKSGRAGVSVSGGLVDVQREGLEGHGGNGNNRRKSRRVDAQSNGSITAASASGRLADAADGTGERSIARAVIGIDEESVGALQTESRYTSPTNGFWRDADWLFCRDGKWRPVEPGTFPLAHGAAARVLRLCGYGDGINAEQAAHFIKTTKYIGVGNLA